jgi:hypothetical protein
MESRRQRNFFWAAWLILGVWFLVPLWAVRVVPLHDLPNHLARITALHYLGDPSWNLRPFYQRSLSLVPYLGHYYVVHLLTYVFGTVTRANLVFMSIYVLSVPLAARALLLSLGRSPLLALLAYPIAVGYFFQWGFIAYCLAGALMLWGCAELHRHLETPTRASAARLFFACLCIYLCHVLPWALFGAYAMVLLIVELRRRRIGGALWASSALLPVAEHQMGGLAAARPRRGGAAAHRHRRAHR